MAPESCQSRAVDGRRALGDALGASGALKSVPPRDDRVTEGPRSTDDKWPADFEPPRNAY